MPIKPPKCKTCGKEEWRHTCAPSPDPRIVALVEKRVEAINVAIADYADRVAADLMNHGTVGIMAHPTPTPKKRGRPKTQTPEQRAAYLALKAKERRARKSKKGHA